MHTPDPDALWVLLAHGAHTVDPPALKVLAGQGGQEVAPMVVLDDPAAQGTHAPADM